jgi:hypothetical protein
LRCIHCGESAGLRREHPACRERHDAAVAQFPGFFVKYLASPMPPDKFRTLAEEIASGAHIRGDAFKAVCADGLKAMIAAATADDGLKPEDSAHIATLAETFGIDLNAVPDAGSRLTKASMLRDLKEGRLPTGIEIEGPVQLNLQREEAVVWVFNGVACYSLARGDKVTHRQNSAPATITMRINGNTVSTRPAGLDAPAKSPPTKKSAQPTAGSEEGTLGLALEGTGDLVLTNRHLCFLSDVFALRIPVRHIVALVPHRDGLRVLRDNTDGQPQTFVVDDPPFAASAITLLSRLQG